ncbi:hypothetical protein HPB51_007888 [Rhipicephalus microplus]|uniref:Major facilitator superfamily (MFS) profile domain-containing protein n=1 Tax=Rhipicephalus microplus TaxID=6941 RepID=A0A9J6ENB3_RHIMP|nr:hypothetical protein HPB51_007888 [Rhipicephalus microplus]
MTSPLAGAVLSSQNLAYAGSKLLFGVLSDRVSSRLLFASGLLLSAAFTIVLAAVASVSVEVFAVLWFLNGCAQGCGWPSLIKVLQQVGIPQTRSLKQWFLQAQFGTLYGVLAASANVSLSIAPFLSSYLMVAYNWRVSVGFTGVICAVLGALSLFTVVNKPSDVGLSVKESPRSSHAPTDSPARTASAFMSCIEGGGFLGGITAGYVTDWMIVWRSSKGGAGGTSPRVPVSVVLVAGAAVAFHLFSNNVTQHTSELLISLIGLVMGGCLYGAMAIFGVVASECVPTHLSGTSHAIVAFGGSLGGVISGFPLSLVAEHYGWSAVFLLLEVISFFTAVALFVGMNFDARVRAPQASNRDVVVRNAAADADKHDAPAMDALLVEPS